jgi:hypothetical protein
VEGVDIWVDFIAKNSNKLQKLGLEGKISWVLNVFTLGPTAQATLVRRTQWNEHIYTSRLLWRGWWKVLLNTLMIAATQTHSAFVPSM